MNTDLDSLYAQLQDLARHDTGRAVFGASLHQWESVQVSPEDVERFEEAHRVNLPASYRRWIRNLGGTGVGPFYGLQGLPDDGARVGRPFPHAGAFNPEDALPDGVDAHDGTLLLADQGCGYEDRLVLNGPRAGEVWVDFREGGGSFARWYTTFEAWLQAWLTRSRAEWAGSVFPEKGVPSDADPAFLDACKASAEQILRGTDDPMVAQYPVPVDGLRMALAVMDVAAGRFEAAERAFDAAAEVSREPAAMQALGRCLVAEGRGDAEARLAAADAGLETVGLWYNTELRLLRHRRFALEDLERWDDAVATLERIARHASNDLTAQYDLAWVQLLRGDALLAASGLVRVAERKVGCDGTADLPTRVAQVAGPLADALREGGMAEELAALETALVELAPVI